MLFYCKYSSFAMNLYHISCKFSLSVLSISFIFTSNNIRFIEMIHNTKITNKNRKVLLFCVEYLLFCSQKHS